MRWLRTLGCAAWLVVSSSSMVQVEAQPREAAVSDLGSNSVLPVALLPYFSPTPQSFAERAAPGSGAGGPSAMRPEVDGRGTAEEPPLIGYPINQAPIEVSPFGMRYSESRGAWKMHTGIDLIVTEGTPVLAAAGGTVILVDEVSGYGLTVLVDHGGGWQSLYAHLFEIAVKPADVVHRGQPLGRVGDSGRATTPHLHFEIRQRRAGQMLALDPAPFLRPRQPGVVVMSR